MEVALAAAILFFADLCAWMLLSGWFLRLLLVYSATIISRDHNPAPALVLLFLEEMLFFDNVVFASVFTIIFATGAYQLSAWLFVKKPRLTYILVTWGVLLESVMQLWGAALEPALSLTIYRLAAALLTTALINPLCNYPKT